MEASYDMTLEALKELVADLFELEISELEKDTAFHSKEVYDSLKVVLLMAALEEDFDLNVPPDKAGQLNSIQDILDFAKEKGVRIEE